MTPGSPSARRNTEAPFGHRPRRRRASGWTPARLRDFIDALSESGNVMAACRAVGLSRQSAYMLRNRVPAFALAWDGAILRHRDLLVDICMDRALNGVTEEIVIGGKLAERTRPDGVTLRHMLDRADRMAAGRELHDRPARLSEARLEDLLDMLDPPGDTPPHEAMAEPQARAAIADIEDSALPGWDAAVIERHCAARRQAETGGADGGAADPPTGEDRLTPGERERYAYLRWHRALQRTPPGDVDVGDLDPAACGSWDQRQWDRADRAGLLDGIDWEAPEGGEE